MECSFCPAKFRVNSDVFMNGYVTRVSIFLDNPRDNGVDSVTLAGCEVYLHNAKVCSLRDIVAVRVCNDSCVFDLTYDTRHGQLSDEDLHTMEVLNDLSYRTHKCKYFVYKDGVDRIYLE